MLDLPRADWLHCNPGVSGRQPTAASRLGGAGACRSSVPWPLAVARRVEPSSHREVAKSEIRFLHLIGYPQLKPHDRRHGVAMEVLAEHHDVEEVRALLGHTRIDTTQLYASIRPRQLKQAVAFYEEKANRMLGN